MTSIYVNKDTVLPERKKNDLYRTEKSLIHATMRSFAPDKADRILDPGAGDGRWGAIAAEYLFPSTLVGVELEDQPKPTVFTEWYANQDYLSWNTKHQFDLILGNPPYFIAEEFIRKSWNLLAPGGVLVFLLRLAFMEGVARYEGLWRELPPNEVAVCSRRPSFYGTGTNGTAFAVFGWRKSKLFGIPTGTPRTWKVSLLLHERDWNGKADTAE